MEAKYYTPEIEEFHIGFEYYFNDIGTDGEDLYDENTKAVIKDGTQIDDITRLQDGKPVYNLFVKYLDRQDVEELGLKLKIWDNGSGYFTKDNYTFGIYSTGLFCTISQNDFGNNIMRFSGEIKNKSELKKLMKMLNIETK